MPKAPPKPLAYPKSFGACADLLFDLKTERLALQKSVDEVKGREYALTEHIIANLSKSDTGAKGLHYQVSVVTQRVPRVVDWDAFYEFVRKKKLFHLLQKRLSEPAIDELWEGGKEVPGVEANQIVKLSLTKV